MKKYNKAYNNRRHNRPAVLFVLIVIAFGALSIKTSDDRKTTLYDLGINLIPYPQEVLPEGKDFIFDGKISIVLDQNASNADRFAAEQLRDHLSGDWNINSTLTGSPAGKSILLSRQNIPDKITSLPENKKDQAYQLQTSSGRLKISAIGEAGLFYGVQTLLQIIRKDNRGFFVKGMKITDWPDIPVRAIHYDTKHHQDKGEYVEGFIRDLASYKINMLVWEWEDKFEYPSHPEIGAPGAFTMKEMQEMTHYAQRYHIQIVPLVQGLGHVSYILKWPQYSHLREIPASNWEFCPQKDGTYELLNDLWQDAIEATPGSEYIHIGCDETYELGQGVDCGCAAMMKEIGRQGLYTTFINRAARPLIQEGRKVMAWSRAQYNPGEKMNPLRGMVLLNPAKNAGRIDELHKVGYEVFVYDPNPGIEPLFLPYFYRLKGEMDDTVFIGKIEIETSLQRSYNEVSVAAKSGMFDGMINTSWDDSGLHNQVWMMSFVNSAEFSWSGSRPSLDEFSDKFFPNYYGENSADMKELYLLLDKAAYYYYDSFERRVWHYGDVGKTHLPDLPRGDNLEYDEFWNREYAGKIKESKEELKQMERASDIIRTNMEAGIKNSYDLEIFNSIVELVKHTCNTYLALSEIEITVKEAHNQRFLSHEAAYGAMKKAINIIDNNLSERQKVYDELVKTWEKTRLPKGMSTPGKQYFYRQDRARHFAYRKADMSYLIWDEQLLGLEDYRAKLSNYMDWYKKTFISNE